MNRVDSACEDIIKKYTGNSEYLFEKQAECSRVKVAQEPKISVKLPDSISLQKIASAIREATAPVTVSFEDVDTFIKQELYNV